MGLGPSGATRLLGTYICGSHIMWLLFLVWTIGHLITDKISYHGLYAVIHHLYCGYFCFSASPALINHIGSLVTTNILSQIQHLGRLSEIQKRYRISWISQIDLSKCGQKKFAVFFFLARRKFKCKSTF